MLRQLLERFRERNAKMQEADQDYRVAKTLEQRRKSADEREVERFIEEQRQEQIREQAKQIRAMKTAEAWKGTNNILQERNVFLNHHSVLTDNPRLNSWNSNSLKGGMFWK